MPRLHTRAVTATGSTPSRWILITHGIYGAGRNWLSVARRFVEDRPDWGAQLVDLRMHGESLGFQPPHTVQACAQDLAELVEDLETPVEAVLGHSFGGKVALVYSQSPAAPLSHVWVVDSTPDRREPGGSAWTMLRVLRLHPGPFPDRAAGVAAVESEGYATPVAQWMSTNLASGNDGYRWRLDADVMEALLRSFFATDVWNAVEAPSPPTHVHVIRAAESSVLTDAACRRIEIAGERTGHAHLHTVAGGHWVNADNPEALLELLFRYMA